MIRSFFALLMTAAVVAAEAVASDGDVREIAVEARQISQFKDFSEETRFGGFEFLGGLEISSPSGVLGGISALRMTGDGPQFIGAMDSGLLFSGRFMRDADGRLSGLSDFVTAPVLDADGRAIREGWKTDAEGLALNGEYAYVSFERQHRIERYRLSDVPGGAPVERIRHLIPDWEFRRNRGMEMLAVAPPDAPLAGALVVVSERSLDQKGDLFAAIVSGPETGVFFVKRDPPYDVTDGDFLPDGDLLLLERRFSLAGGIGMRIRRIAGADIAPGRTVDGEVLLEADFGYAIDNMESLDIFTTEDGDTRIVLASDDNFSFLQRNVILEFRLVEQ
ncbi:MAG: esterase-like activity of phytase family protein [Pseudomonadota bacterium]